MRVCANIEQHKQHDITAIKVLFILYHLSNIKFLDDPILIIWHKLFIVLKTHPYYESNKQYINYIV
jgi:hypothetical protein